MVTVDRTEAVTLRNRWIQNCTHVEEQMKKDEVPVVMNAKRM